MQSDARRLRWWCGAKCNSSDEAIGGGRTTSGREALNNYDDRVAVRRVEEAIRLD